MTDKSYNGWTNYATWRVNLEIFDGASCNDYYIGSFLEPYDVGLALKEHAEEFIEQSSPEGLARDYAMAFLSDVNWYEIAEHLIEDYISDNEVTE